MLLQPGAPAGGGRGAPVAGELDALVVGAPAPAVGLLHAEAQGVVAAQLDGLAVHRRSAWHLQNILECSCGCLGSMLHMVRLGLCIQTLNGQDVTLPLFALSMHFELNVAWKCCDAPTQGSPAPHPQ